MADIEHVYDQIELGNATVTAHLASIVKVHETQDEVLNAADLAGLRERIGIGLSDTSDKVAAFINGAKKVDGTLADAQDQVKNLAAKLDALTEGDK